MTTKHGHSWSWAMSWHSSWNLKVKKTRENLNCLSAGIWTIEKEFFRNCFGCNHCIFFVGLPHGPSWIYSRFHEKFVFVHFNQGQLVPDDVIMINEKNFQFGIKGKLVNSTFLQNVVNVRIDSIGDHNCLQVIKTTEISKDDEMENAIVESIVLR